MELKHPKFDPTARGMLESKGPFLMTCGQRGQGLLADAKKIAQDSADMQLITVTKENRDTLPEEIVKLFKS